MSEPNEELIEAGWRAGWRVGLPELRYIHSDRGVTVSVSEEQALKVERRHRNHAGEGVNISGQPVRERIYAAINEERRRQRELWGDQWEPGQLGESQKLAILVEEVGEVAQELQPGGTARKLRKELVEAGAVTVAWLESLSEWEEDHD